MVIIIILFSPRNTSEKEYTGRVFSKERSSSKKVLSAHTAAPATCSCWWFSDECLALVCPMWWSLWYKDNLISCFFHHNCMISSIQYFIQFFFINSYVTSIKWVYLNLLNHCWACVIMMMKSE